MHNPCLIYIVCSFSGVGLVQAGCAINITVDHIGQPGRTLHYWLNNCPEIKSVVSPPVKIVSLHTTDERCYYCSGDECRGLELLTYSYTIEPFNKSLAGLLTGPLTGLNREDPPDTRLHSRQLGKSLTKPGVVFIFYCFYQYCNWFILNHAPGSVKEKDIRFWILDTA